MDREASHEKCTSVSKGGVDTTCAFLYYSPKRWVRAPEQAIHTIIGKDVVDHMQTPWICCCSLKHRSVMRVFVGLSSSRKCKLNNYCYGATRAHARTHDTHTAAAAALPVQQRSPPCERSVGSGQLWETGRPVLLSAQTVVWQ